MNTRLRKKHITAAYRYSFSRLVLNYYLYYEHIWKDNAKLKEELIFGERFGKILRSFLYGENTVQELEELRNQIIGKMEILTAFSDCFQIYEYVLNRVERRFVILESPEDTPQEQAAKLVDWIAMSEHGADRNERLRSVVAQLPIRFTRPKFYSMVTEKISAYGGLNKANIENFLYMLKTSVMVVLPEHMEQEKELYLWLEELKHADYRNLSQAEFETCMKSLQEASQLILEKTDYYIAVQELVNDLYVLNLTCLEGQINESESHLFQKGAEMILDALETEDRQFSEEEGEDLLRGMEGIQEEVMDIVMSGSSEKDEILGKIDRLVSGSHFMSLEEKVEVSEEADKAWIDEKAKEFCRELDQMFLGMQKAVIRAVMAKVLSSLPMIFQDSMEVEQYIRSSLESCADFAEREASIELLQSIQEEMEDFPMTGQELIE
ncbi:MAG: hypothetical protein HFG68_05645 [Hungatella sp.]|nr:hypothetical protein [Hungatella sp.]